MPSEDNDAKQESQRAATEAVATADADLRTLHTFAATLLERNDPDDLLWSMAENIGALLRFKDCVIYLREADELVQVAAYGIKNPEGRRIRNPISIPLGQGIVGIVGKTGRAERVRDTASDGRYIFDEFPGRSELAVPLVYENNVLGVLDSEGPTPDWYTDADQELFEQVAVLAGPRIALLLGERERRKAEAALRRLSEELEQRVVERTAKLSEANEILTCEIAERKLAEEKLRESHNLLSAVLEGATDIVFVKDLHGRYLMMNERGAAAGGMSVDEIIGKDDSQLFPPDIVEQFRKEDEEVLTSGQLRTFEYVVDLVGQARAYLTMKGPWRNTHGDIIGVVGISCDVTERKRLEREILEISAREQRQIGQDLHDGIGQRLTGIAFLSKALAQKLAAESSAKTADAVEIEKLVNATITQTRNLAKGLHPTALATGGLVVALEELASTTQQLFDVSCVLTADGAAPLLDNVATQLYFVAREAVNNAVKHAEAKKITLELQTAGHTTTLTVEDDGRGFPADGEAAQGMGLHLMRYRAGMIDGFLDIRPRSDGGTLVICSFPTPPTEEGESKAYVPGFGAQLLRGVEGEGGELRPSRAV